ncbi:MAG: hypothetical protein RI909_825, partial [Bacteroidota bacterium]
VASEGVDVVVDLVDLNWACELPKQKNKTIGTSINFFMRRLANGVQHFSKPSFSFLIRANGLIQILFSKIGP